MSDIDISRKAIEQIALTCRARDLFYEADTIFALLDSCDHAELIIGCADRMASAVVGGSTRNVLEKYAKMYYAARIAP